MDLGEDVLSKDQGVQTKSDDDTWLESPNNNNNNEDILLMS